MAPRQRTIEREIARKLVTIGYRVTSQKFHPDHGGSDELMTGISAARDLLRKLLR